MTIGSKLNHLHQQHNHQLYPVETKHPSLSIVLNTVLESNELDHAPILVLGLLWRNKICQMSHRQRSCY